MFSHYYPSSPYDYYYHGNGINPFFTTIPTTTNHPRFRNKYNSDRNMSNYNDNNNYSYYPRSYNNNNHNYIRPKLYHNNNFERHNDYDYNPQNYNEDIKSFEPEKITTRRIKVMSPEEIKEREREKLNSSN